ncbi:MAG: DegT/DnrJ/EryC1/StrS family aminotransferase, partial [Armatimonadota bacterium]
MTWDVSRPVTVGRPNVAPRESFAHRVSEVMASGWLTNQGPQVRLLEDEIARFLGVRHAILVANATLGLQIALKSIVEEGEVIMPSFTFAATAQAARWCGLSVRFVDIDPETQQLDLGQLEATITSRTRAIIPVHMWGAACDVDRLSRIAEKNGLKLVYDAAHAFGSERLGVKVGRFGDAEVFSFHATKFFNTLEGGAVVTNDDDVANRVRRMRSFGMGTEGFSADGTNAKMSELHAAHGLCLLPEVPGLLQANHRVLDAIELALSSVEGLRVVPTRGGGITNGQYAIVCVAGDAAIRD